MYTEESWLVIDSEALRKCKKIHTVRERVDLGVLSLGPVDPAKASKCVLPVDVHSARATNTLTT